ncbi:hypothetical protein COCCADRAFT_38837 [Bipolaris zeicola 26-R-13]|uniref:DUF7730 domain-containing protein n=1 Tax=Cochliobolus carbonum (strain 26-R-13) TaxID=930089 RepID=W6Y6W1_COCC2|nr:uncharacterized protein COCCADRAFT_38837 [Bipolaris zeicola 26-R-13]EUC31004.1 hypothetical protein COCCADRAFT_38837 [Bipolaris zeicola 26-R-13]
MSAAIASAETFASGRYSKRKRTQVSYHLDDLEYSDTESEFESPQAKKPKAQTTKPLPKRKIFPFLDLPAEIRNTIYNYTLCDPSGIKFVGTYHKKRRVATRVSTKYPSSGGRYDSPTSKRVVEDVLDADGNYTPLVPSLLAVNKQIYSEGIDILYGNQLTFADSFALYSFLINLGPARAQRLKKLRVLGWLHSRGLKVYNNACFAALAWATNLTSLVVHVHINKYCSPRRAADQFYRDAFPWLEAVSAAKGKHGAALDVVTLDETALSDSWVSCNSDESVPTPKEKAKHFKAELAKCLDEHRDMVLKKSKNKMAKKVKS